MEANEAKQMEMLLQEGGIADDGTTVDPVSGNEVPPGSMAEEVRDDVPAQLSEGEYVVPADVTRYYGVKFFEDLRTQAKQGMAQMEAEGRIGGEPVSQTMDNQAEGALTPEELAMLQEMGMAVGGMVTPPPQAVGNTGEYNKGGQVLYAQDGVDVSAASASTSGVNPYQAQFTQGMGTAFAPGYLSQQIIEASQAPQSSIVMLYSPDGIAVSVTLPAEQAKYDQLVAEGYTTQPVATTTETTVTTGNDDPPPPETTKAMTPDYTRMTTEELAKRYSQNQTAMAMMAGMAAINPIFGAFGVWATNNTKKKIIEAGYKPPEGGSIFDLSLNDLVGKVKDVFGLSDEETKAVVAQVSSGDDNTVTPTPSETSAILSGGGATGDDDGPTVVTGGGTAPTGGGSAGDKYVFEEDTTDYDSTDDDVFDQIDAEFASAAANPAPPADNSSSYGVGTYNTETGSGGFNAGGFVSKRSKKNKKK
ncbi:hypothetical protein [Planktomarina sp.]|uniref:hypothetical protein n=1 Tax=Planktomarina sp. TaxID=2024851 RepID=UPI00326170A3